MSGFNSTDPVTACYEARFSFYGVIGSPERVTCPEGAKGIVPTAIPAKPKAVIPAGFDATLKKMLSTGPAPAHPTAAELKARVITAMPSPTVDPGTGLRNLMPSVETAINGADVGVSVQGWSREDCLLGARVAGKVMVWRPSRIQMQPGELTCDPHTALQLAGISAPH